MQNTEPNRGDAEVEAGQDTSRVGAGDEAMNQLMAEYEAKLGEMRELLLRERAELDNQRKRLQRDLEQARKFANERLLAALLPVIDNLERGLSANADDRSGLQAGVELTLKELLPFLDMCGQLFTFLDKNALHNIAQNKFFIGKIAILVFVFFQFDHFVLQPGYS